MSSWQTARTPRRRLRDFIRIAAGATKIYRSHPDLFDDDTKAIRRAGEIAASQRPL